ncbi:RNA-binding S4 domain-containing protein [Culturomica massiliensis]|jgi:ribosome-associated protein|uniref:RNA-binding S4 domain-containing protein n=2 Tax=Odoribacteraceae TaxID=1853231 RepID=UPI003AB53139
MRKDMIEFILTEEYIELIRLLKLVRIADSGGMAKMLVENGEVKRNGETEYRKRAKIKAGETIEVAGETIRVKA